MTNTTNSLLKPSRKWLIYAIIAFVLFIGNVATNLVSKNLEEFVKPYRTVVWLFFVVALITAVTVAILDARRTSDRLASTAGGNLIAKSRQPIVNGGTEQEESKIEPSSTLIRPGSAPPLPSLIIGREEAMRDLKTRLGIAGKGQIPAPLQVVTVVRGWPGVGKTTLAAALAHDADIALKFPDGVLWASIGQTPSVLSELAAWGRALGAYDLLRASTVEEATAQLSALLRNKRVLLILDDVWEAEHAVPFKVGGRECAMLITTRVPGVAQALAPTPSHIYNLGVLAEQKAFELFQALAPTVATQYPAGSLELVRELEGLPLAIQVAGHMLNVEASYGFGVAHLLQELREGSKLLEAKAPADRADIAKEKTPTLAVLLQKSTDRLDNEVRERFAYLGAFAPKPATFDLAAMQAVWQVEDPKPTAHVLVERGLLEPVPGTGRFQMHALLVLHARSLLAE